MENGDIADLDVVGPIDVRFENRKCMAEAIVFDGPTCFLGFIAINDMDTVICPERQTLIVNPKHPDYALHRMRGFTLFENRIGTRM